jgi:hypothetical protein
MRRSITAAGIALVALTAAASAQQTSTSATEPTWRDRPLSAWVRDLQTAEAPYSRNMAAYAISGMGAAAAPAVPALIEALNNPDEVSTVIYPIEVALREIGPAAAAAVPALQKKVEYPNDDVSHMARKALKAITGVEVPKPQD